MRKILFSILAGGFILIGCNSKDGGGSASIVGTWNANRILTQTYSNNVLEESDTTTTGSITFESNGNLTAVDEDGSSTTGIYTYASSNKLLTVITDMDTTILNVTNLTASNLHLHQEQTQVLSGITIKALVDADYSK